MLSPSLPTLNMDCVESCSAHLAIAREATRVRARMA